MTGVTTGVAVEPTLPGKSIETSVPVQAHHRLSRRRRREIAVATIRHHGLHSQPNGLSIAIQR